MLEKYAFKTVVATSLESYTQLLTAKFDSKNKKQQEKMLSFVVDTMDTIYGEPHEDITKRTWGFGVGHKIANMKAEVIEEIDNKLDKAISEQTS